MTSIENNYNYPETSIHYFDEGSGQTEMTMLHNVNNDKSESLMEAIGSPEDQCSNISYIQADNLSVIEKSGVDVQEIIDQMQNLNMNGTSLHNKYPGNVLEVSGKMLAMMSFQNIMDKNNDKAERLECTKLLHQNVCPTVSNNQSECIRAISSVENNNHEGIHNSEDFSMTIGPLSSQHLGTTQEALENPQQNQCTDTSDIQSDNFSENAIVENEINEHREHLIVNGSPIHGEGPGTWPQNSGNALGVVHTLQNEQQCESNILERLLQQPKYVTNMASLECNSRIINYISNDSEVLRTLISNHGTTPESEYSDSIMQENNDSRILIVDTRSLREDFPDTHAACLPTRSATDRHESNYEEETLDINESEVFNYHPSSNLEDTERNTVNTSISNIIVRNNYQSEVPTCELQTVQNHFSNITDDHSERLTGIEGFENNNCHNINDGSETCNGLERPQTSTHRLEEYADSGIVKFFEKSNDLSEIMLEAHGSLDVDGSNTEHSDRFDDYRREIEVEEAPLQNRKSPSLDCSDQTEISMDYEMLLQDQCTEHSEKLPSVSTFENNLHQTNILASEDIPRNPICENTSNEKHFQSKIGVADIRKVMKHPPDSLLGHVESSLSDELQCTNSVSEENTNNGETTRNVPRFQSDYHKNNNESESNNLNGSRLYNHHPGTSTSEYTYWQQSGNSINYMSAPNSYQELSNGSYYTTSQERTNYIGPQLSEVDRNLHYQYEPNYAYQGVYQTPSRGEATQYVQNPLIRHTGTTDYSEISSADEDSQVGTEMTDNLLQTEDSNDSLLDIDEEPLRNSTPVCVSAPLISHIPHMNSMEEQVSNASQHIQQSSENLRNRSYEIHDITQRHSSVEIPKKNHFPHMFNSASDVGQTIPNQNEYLNQEEDFQEKRIDEGTCAESHAECDSGPGMETNQDVATHNQHDGQQREDSNQPLRHFVNEIRTPPVNEVEDKESIPVIKNDPIYCVIRKKLKCALEFRNKDGVLERQPNHIDATIESYFKIMNNVEWTNERTKILLNGFSIILEKDEPSLIKGWTPLGEPKNSLLVLGSDTKSTGYYAAIEEIR